MHCTGFTLEYVLTLLLETFFIPVHFRQCWKEVNDLETKKEELMKSGPVESKMDVDSDEDLNEEALDEFLDWRSKKSWR